MDAVKTLSLMDGAIKNGDRDLVSAYAGDLIAWIYEEGFIPNANGWRSKLSKECFLGYLRDIRRVAEIPATIDEE